MLLNVAKLMFSHDVESFFNDELKKSLELSWQSNSKLNSLILLLDNAITVNQIMTLNPNIPNELIEAVTERSSACLVRRTKIQAQM